MLYQDVYITNQNGVKNGKKTYQKLTVFFIFSIKLVSLVVGDLQNTNQLQNHYIMDNLHFVGFDDLTKLKPSKPTCKL